MPDVLLLLSRVSTLPRTTTRTIAAAADATRRRRWMAPVLLELPRLADLTLQTGAPISGGGSGSGGVTFP